MVAQTITLAVVFALLALTRANGGASIGVLIGSALIWPEFLRFPFGPIEASVPRFVAAALVIAAIVKGRQSNIRGVVLDRLLVALWGWTILAALLAEGTFSKHVTAMIGRGLDTILMYFVVRLYVKSFDDLVGLAKWAGVTAIIMGTLGLIESTTSRTLYGGLEAYRTWSWIDKEDQYRHGFLRAKGSMDVHIYFGMAMMLLTGLLWSVQRGLKRSRLSRMSVWFAVFGVLSSMSSGPWMGCALIFLFAMYRHKPHLIKPTLYAIGAMALAIEVMSNRHFYNLIDYLALDPHTAWYRTKLMEVAFSRLGDFWLVGTGSNFPHHWGLLLDGRDHIDVVNHFLILGIYGGLPAMALYIASHYLAIKCCVITWRDALGPLRVTLFCLGSVLVALDFSSLSVGLYGPPQILSYILLGMIVAISTISLQQPDLKLSESQEVDSRHQVRNGTSQCAH